MFISRELLRLSSARASCAGSLRIGQHPLHGRQKQQQRAATVLRRLLHSHRHTSRHHSNFSHYSFLILILYCILYTVYCTVYWGPSFCSGAAVRRHRLRVHHGPCCCGYCRRASETEEEELAVVAPDRKRTKSSQRLRPTNTLRGLGGSGGIGRYTAWGALCKDVPDDGCPGCSDAGAASATSAVPLSSLVCFGSGEGLVFFFDCGTSTVVGGGAWSSIWTAVSRRTLFCLGNGRGFPSGRFCWKLGSAMLQQKRAADESQSETKQMECFDSCENAHCRKRPPHP